MVMVAFLNKSLVQKLLIKFVLKYQMLQIHNKLGSSQKVLSAHV